MEENKNMNSNKKELSDDRLKQVAGGANPVLASDLHVGDIIIYDTFGNGHDYNYGTITSVYNKNGKNYADMHIESIGNVQINSGTISSFNFNVTIDLTNKTDDYIRKLDYLPEERDYYEEEPEFHLYFFNFYN